MKKLSIFIISLLFSLFLYAETYITGERFEPYSPKNVGVYINNGHYVYPIVSCIKKTSNSDEYEFSVTMFNSSYGEFPLTVTYIVEKNSNIVVKNYNKGKILTLVVVDVSNNYIELKPLEELQNQ